MSSHAGMAPMQRARAAVHACHRPTPRWSRERCARLQAEHPVELAPEPLRHGQVSEAHVLGGHLDVLGAVVAGPVNALPARAAALLTRVP